MTAGTAASRPLGLADLAGIAALALIWGTNFILVAEALQGLNPAQIVFVRLGLAAGSLWLLVWIGKGSVPRSARSWWMLAGMGLIGQMLPWLLFGLGQREVTSSVAGFYTGLTPLLTIPAAWLLLRERPTRTETVVAMIGVVGLAVVLAPGGDAAASMRGQLLCLAGATCYALAFCYAARLIRELAGSKLVLAAVQALAGWLVMAPAGAGGLLAPVRATWLIVLCLALLGVGTAAALVLNYWLVARIGPVRSSFAFYLVPVVAIVAGVAVRGERLGVHQVVGTAIVVGALALLYVWQRGVERRQLATAARVRA